MGTAVESRATAGSDRSEGAPAEAEVAPEPHLGRIPALDGIRALGIVLVLFFHGGFSWAGGGFFGVDVFFVLSGFLITGLLVSEYRQNAGIGLARFWGHRVRRLVPALLVMLVGVALYGLFAAPSDTLGQLRSDAIATLLYVNNWHLAPGGQGYFAALNTPRPLLHTWSLSIEEQFYLVWPLVVLGVLRWTRSLRALLVLTVVGRVASAVTMAVVYGNGSGESRAYYGTDTRAQALLIGAALAIVLAHPLPRRRSGPVTTTSLVRSFALTPAARARWWPSGGLDWWQCCGCPWSIQRDGVDLPGRLHPGGGGHRRDHRQRGPAAGQPVGPGAQPPSGAVHRGHLLRPLPLPLADLRGGRQRPDGAGRLAVVPGPGRSVLCCGGRVLPLPRDAGPPWRVAGMAGVGRRLPWPSEVRSPWWWRQRPGQRPRSTQFRWEESGNRLLDGTRRRAIRAPLPSSRRWRPEPVARSGCSWSVIPRPASSDSGSAPMQRPTTSTTRETASSDVGCSRHHVVPRDLVNGDVGERGGHVVVPCDTQLTRWKADVDAYHPDVVLLADGEYEVRNQLIGKQWVHIGSTVFDKREMAALTSATRVLGSTGAKVVLLTAPYYHQLEQADGQGWPEDNPTRVNLYNSMLGEVAKRSHGRVVVANVNARLDPRGHFTTTVDGQVVRFSDGIHVTPAGAKLISPWLLDMSEQLGTANRTQGVGTTATSP